MTPPLDSLQERENQTYCMRGKGMKAPSAVSYAYPPHRERTTMPRHRSISHRPLAALLALAFIAGCGTLADVEKAKQSWQGASYDEVVARWGQPTSQSQPTKDMQTYDWVSEHFSGGGSSVGAWGGSGGS